MEPIRSYFSINVGLPQKHRGSAPALIVTACMLAQSPTRPSTPEAPTASFPSPPLRLLLPGGAIQFPGGTFTRSEPAPFTAHVLSEFITNNAVSIPCASDFKLPSNGEMRVPEHFTRPNERHGRRSPAQDRTGTVERAFSVARTG